MATNPVEVQTSDLLDSLERKIFLLRTEYEQYFLGIVKKEPSDKRDEVVTILRNFSKGRINNTANNFRYQQLQARFNTLSLYWTRTLKQIEEGTFRRDHFRVKLRIKEEEERKLLDAASQESRRQEDSRQQAEAARAAIRDTVSDAGTLKNLYQEFLQARQRCKERTDNVQYEKMVEFMQQQTSALKERYQCKAVQFQVVEDGGKTKLKAVPIR